MVIEEGILKQDILNIISKTTEVPISNIADDSHFVEDLGADSMLILEIMVALEKKFKINIQEDDLPKMATLRQAMDLVKKLLK